MRIFYTADGGVVVTFGTVIEAITGRLVPGTGVFLLHPLSLLYKIGAPLFKWLTISGLNSRAASCDSTDSVILNEICI